MPTVRKVGILLALEVSMGAKRCLALRVGKSTDQFYPALVRGCFIMYKTVLLIGLHVQMNTIMSIDLFPTSYAPVAFLNS